LVGRVVEERWGALQLLHPLALCAEDQTL